MPGGKKIKRFCKKIRKQKNGMYRLAHGILQDEEDARDAIINAVVAAYEHLGSFRASDRFKTWIYRILTNECYNIIGTRKHSLDTEAVYGTADSDADFDRGTPPADAVNIMKLEYRIVTILYYYESINIKEISKILNTSEDNVGKRLSKARGMLKSLI